MNSAFLLVLMNFLVGSCPVPGSPPVKSGFIKTSDGVSIHYLEAGNGPSMLFVPGSSMPAEIWEPQICYFSPNHRVVAMDPRSQGESGQTSEGNYPARRARDIKEVINQLKLAPSALVSWSMSVRDTLAYIRQFGTSSLTGIVLVDGLIGPPDTRQAREIWTGIKQMQLNRSEFTERFVRSLYRKPQAKEYLQRITALSLRTPTNTAIALSANAFIENWEPALDELNKPVLYIWSSPARQADAKALKQKVPSAEVQSFNDAGHALFVDESGRFNLLVERFLQEHGSKR